MFDRDNHNIGLQWLFFFSGNSSPNTDKKTIN